jgi:hypothetical protein
VLVSLTGPCRPGGVIKPHPADLVDAPVPRLQVLVGEGGRLVDKVVGDEEGVAVDGVEFVE